jgi:fructosamine-3-kinase
LDEQVKVAVKLEDRRGGPYQQQQQQPGSPTAGAQPSLLNESLVLKKLGQGNIDIVPRYYEHGTKENYNYLVMEWIEQGMS